jgi:hypothetical protein
VVMFCILNYSHLIMILICIFLMISDVENLFIYLLAMCVCMCVCLRQSCYVVQADLELDLPAFASQVLGGMPSHAGSYWPFVCLLWEKTIQSWAWWFTLVIPALSKEN